MKPEESISHPLLWAVGGGVIGSFVLSFYEESSRGKEKNAKK